MRLAESAHHGVGAAEARWRGGGCGARVAVAARPPVPRGLDELRRCPPSLWRRKPTAAAAPAAQANRRARPALSVPTSHRRRARRLRVVPADHVQRQWPGAAARRGEPSLGLFLRLAPTGARAYGACGWVGGEGERGRRKPSAARRPPRAQVFFVCCGKSARMHASTTAERSGISFFCSACSLGARVYVYVYAYI